LNQATSLSSTHSQLPDQGIDLGQEPPGPLVDNEGGGIGEVLRAVWRRKIIAALCFFLVAALGTGYSFLVKKPQFQAQAKVLLDIKTRPARVLGAPELGEPFDTATEVEVMRSQTILDRGAQVLDLAGLDAQLWLRRVKYDVPRGSRVMTISARGPTPETARDLANALADAYVEHRRRVRNEEVDETLSWLREQQADAKVRRLQAEEAFQKFKKANGIPSLETKRETDIQRYQTLSDAYLQAQQLRIEAETQLHSLEKATTPNDKQAKQPGQQTKAGGESASPSPAEDALVAFPATLTGKGETELLAIDDRSSQALGRLISSPVLEKLAAAIQQKELELQAQSQVLKERHPRIRQLKRELELLKAQYESAKKEIEEHRDAFLQAQHRATIERLKRRVAALKREEEIARRALEDWRNQLLLVTDVAVEYEILEREAQRARQEYDLITSKIREVSFASASKDNTARVLDRAQPGLPIKLHRPRDIFLSLFGGFALAVAVCLFLERLDTSIKTPEDVHRYLGLPVVALIPTHTTEDERAARNRSRSQRRALPTAASSTT